MDVNNIEVPAPQSNPQGRTNKTYTIKIGHFVTLAQTIVDKDPGITVPRSILNLLSDVINLRKSVSDMVCGGTEEARDGHLYFIMVLEKSSKYFDHWLNNVLVIPPKPEDETPRTMFKSQSTRLKSWNSKNQNSQHPHPIKQRLNPRKNNPRNAMILSPPMMAS